MSDDSQRPIVIKRVKKAAHGHHGGAWKIAYADFDTAMMAFFLLMWLLGSTTRAELAGIADYFKTPLKIALQGGSGTGSSTSIIKSGGTDLTRIVGKKKPTGTDEQKTVNLQAVKVVVVEKKDTEKEKEKLKELKAKLEKTMDSNPMLKQFKKQPIAKFSRSTSTARSAKCITPPSGRPTRACAW